MFTKGENKNKGFTLVELIVVLVILAILAAILVPALLGYIDRAKQEKSVRKVHEIQVAATSALVEYYGLYKDKVTKKFTPKNYNVNGNTVRGYNITNYTFSRLQDSDNSGNDCSDAVARRVLQYLESNKSTKEKEYTFSKYSDSTYGKSASDVANAGAEGLIILFGEEYKLSVIQYSDLDGYLYTYDAQSGEIDVQENGKFIATGK